MNTTIDAYLNICDYSQLYSGCSLSVANQLRTIDLSMIFLYSFAIIMAFLHFLTKYHFRRKYDPGATKYWTPFDPAAFILALAFILKIAYHSLLLQTPLYGSTPSSTTTAVQLLYFFYTSVSMAGLGSLQGALQGITMEDVKQNTGKHAHSSLIFFLIYSLILTATTFVLGYVFLVLFVLAARNQDATGYLKWRAFLYLSPPACFCIMQIPVGLMSANNGIDHINEKLDMLRIAKGSRHNSHFHKILRSIQIFWVFYVCCYFVWAYYLATIVWANYFFSVNNQSSLVVIKAINETLIWIVELGLVVSVIEANVKKFFYQWIFGKSEADIEEEKKGGENISLGFSGMQGTKQQTTRKASIFEESLE